MAIYAKAANAASVGATANTFDNVGTITLRSDARKLYGFWVCAAPVTYTAAEEVTGQVKITSGDLGLGSQIYSCPPYMGGGPATNGMYTNHSSEFIPCFVDNLSGKEQITVDFSTNLPDPTAACSAVVSAIYEAGDKESSTEARHAFPYMSAIAKGASNASKASITTTAETDFAIDQQIPAWAKEIVGVKPFMIPNLMTAGEEVVGFIRYRSTMPNWEPQEWPFVYAIGAPLGTPVGTGANPQWVVPYACGFPTTGQNESVRAYCVLNASITTGHAAVSTIYYR